MGAAHSRSRRLRCRQQDGRYGVVECKGNSFGPESSTARQARTLPAAVGPRLDEALGLRSGTITRSTAGYLVPSQAAGRADGLRAGALGSRRRHVRGTKVCAVLA
jgi:hypothetical protein